MKIAKKVYLNKDVVSLAEYFIGKLLVTYIDGHITSGIITETEAYSHINDKASHANNNKKTKRNANMFLEGGHAYVYLCYGMHSLFNIVTNKENIPDAVLIRAIKPYQGIDIMIKRRNVPLINPNNKKFAEGPANLVKVLGINMSHNGEKLMDNTIWLEDIGISYDKSKLHICPRIGVDYAGEDALLPYRFKIDNNDINL